MKAFSQPQLISTFLVVSIVLFSFAPVKRTYQTECVTLETDGYVTLKIWDTKKGDRYPPEQARKDAVDALLFSGIAGSNGCSAQPPLLAKAAEQDQFERIQSSFFARNGRWSMYTRSSATETTLPAALGAKNWKVYQVAVSKNELRKYLEEEKIIMPLSNGF